MLTVQNENGEIANANSYASLSDFATYCTDRGYSLAGYTNEQQEASLVLATDYIDNAFAFKFEMLNEDQGTQFPRNRSVVNNFTETTSGIPKKLIQAQLIAGWLNLSQGEAFVNDSEEANLSLLREKIDVIETEKEFNGGNRSGYKTLAQIKNPLKLTGYLLDAGGLIRS